MVEWFFDEKFVEVQTFLGLIYKKYNKKKIRNFFIVTVLKFKIYVA
jgi:hypothetical protein